jgi:uncharacterized protein YeaO (DUF488 family)
MAICIKLKSLKAPSQESDGFRILIARYRPRYLPKYKENWDEWWKDQAPSRTLWKYYLKDKMIDCPVYVGRFIFEIRNSTEAVNALRTLASTVYRGEKRQQQYGKYHLDKKTRLLHFYVIA